MRRNPRIDDISDAELICFVQWCRLNDERIVALPALCRRVLKAYAGVPAKALERQLQPIGASHAEGDV